MIMSWPYQKVLEIIQSALLLLNNILNEDYSKCFNHCIQSGGHYFEEETKVPEFYDSPLCMWCVCIPNIHDNSYFH